MCRFLLVRSKTPIKPKRFLDQFADMAEASRAPDNDRQADGWGYAWEVRSSKFEVRKNLKPVWECRDMFETFPESTLFAVHARSASFPSQKGVIEYNQPYITDSLCFVFNGVIQGVQLKQELSGSIGAQKIFSLVQTELKSKSPKEALESVKKLLKENSRNIVGLNIGLIIDKNLYALCEYADNASYFGLRYVSNNEMSMICSEPLGNYKWQTMEKGTVIQINYVLG